MLGAKRTRDWMNEERHSHVDGESGTCDWELGQAAQRGGSQPAYKLPITDNVFLLNSDAVPGTSCKVKWFLFGITFDLAVSFFYPLGSSETSSKPMTQYCRTS